MRFVGSLILALLLMATGGCSQKVNDPADVHAIGKSLDDYAKAMNAGDTDGVAALMTDKTVYAHLNVPVAVGRDAIRSMVAGFNSQFKLDFSMPVEDVRVVGDLAVARGSWTLKLTPITRDLAPSSDIGSWIVVFARQPEGSWKWDCVVLNSNQPLPGSTAGGADEQALLQIERDWAGAVLRRDAAALESILAKEFVAHDASGSRNRKQAMDSVKNPSAKLESGDLSDMKVVVLGDTAIVHGLWTKKSTAGGKESSSRSQWTDTFVKRDARWQCAGSYSAPLE
jgi:uncharacterized protein (TIGR02246 family)